MQFQSALVICTRRIGDVLLATPTVKALQAAHPGIKVDMLVFAGTEAVIEPWPALGRIWTIPQRASRAEQWTLLRALWRRYDLAVSLLTGDRPTLYAWVAGRYRTGTLSADRKSRWKRLLLHAWTPFDNLDTHTVVMNLRQVPGLAETTEVDPAVTWRQEHADSVARVCPLVHRSQAYALLHVTPQFIYKEWTISGWATLARWLQAQGLAVLLTAGPTPAEHGYAQQILSLAGSAAQFVPNLRLPEIAFLLSRARLYVGTDTGVSHMAGALGTPSVVLFGPSNPVKWGPWPKGCRCRSPSPWQRVGSQRQGNVILLQGSGPCVPCLEEGCERHIGSRSECLEQLPAERVLRSCGLLLAESSAQPVE